jgi:hypothetical protein
MRSGGALSSSWPSMPLQTTSQATISSPAAVAVVGAVVVAGAVAGVTWRGRPPSADSAAAAVGVLQTP